MMSAAGSICVCVCMFEAHTYACILYHTMSILVAHMHGDLSGTAGIANDCTILQKVLEDAYVIQYISIYTGRYIADALPGHCNCKVCMQS